MAAKKNNAVEKEAPFDWSADAGAGFEHVRQDDLGIPFLQIIQKTSPELDEDSPKYVEGLKAGNIILSTNKKAFGGKENPAIFVPTGYQKAYVEWTPRESGGGYVGTHNQSILSKCVRNDRGQEVLENGNLIVTTAYVMGFVYDEENEDWIPAIVAFTSTQLKKARQWLNIMNSHKMDSKDGNKFTLPMFSHKYHLTTQPESNDKGSWYGWKVESGEMVNELPLVEKARESHKQIASGGVLMLQPPAPEASGEELPF